MNFSHSYSTIDTHTAGEPLRIITSGIPILQGNTILEKRRWAKENIDHVRKALMLEPRGHADMYGCYLSPPISPHADLGVIFIHNEGYSDMCGHGIIALATVAVAQGWVKQTIPETRVGIDAPAGFIEAFVQWDGSKVGKVRFLNVPSFLYKENVQVHTPSYGTITCDIAFGGAFYAYMNVEQSALKVTPQYYRQLIQLGDEVKQAVKDTVTIQHPIESELCELYGTIIDEVISEDDWGIKQRNVCVFADREVDRSPTGTGTAGRLAQLYAKGRLKEGQQLYNESIIGSHFTASLHQKTTLKAYEAVIPQVEGEAFITGFCQWFIDPKDTIGKGVFLR